MKKTIQNNRGYTLLFAVLVSSIVLSVGISILTISKKEFLLSSSARESISAFYAADSGLECALYHSDNTSVFSTTTSLTVNLSPGCMGMNPSIVFTIIPNTYNFTFDLKTQNVDSSACAVVKVSVEDLLNGYVKTTILSKGYNLGWDDSIKKCNLPSPRRVERAIEYTY